MDNKGDDFDLELKAPENGKLPLRRVVPTALLDMNAASLKGNESENYCTKTTLIKHCRLDPCPLL